MKKYVLLIVVSLSSLNAYSPDCPVIEPNEFSGVAALVENLGSVAQHINVIQTNTIQDDILALLINKITLIPIGKRLLNYPQSRIKIIGEPADHEEAATEWCKRKTRNGIAHLYNQGLKISTSTLPKFLLVYYLRTLQAKKHPQCATGQPIINYPQGFLA